MSQQATKRVARSKQSYKAKRVQRPRGNSEENMLLLERFQKSALLRVNYPSILMDDDRLLLDFAIPVAVQIVGTLKVDKELGEVVIGTSGSFIEFLLSPDLEFNYSEYPRETLLDLLDNQLHIGQNLTIVGKNFSIDIYEIVDKDKGQEGNNSATAGIEQGKQQSR